MASTKRDKYMEHLRESGYREVPSGSSKYLKMVKGDHVLWLGKAGAVRTGRTISSSISLTHLTWGQERP